MEVIIKSAPGQAPIRKHSNRFFCPLDRQLYGIHWMSIRLIVVSRFNALRDPFNPLWVVHEGQMVGKERYQGDRSCQVDCFEL
jgi:hypothetical protein